MSPGLEDGLRSDDVSSSSRGHGWSSRSACVFWQLFRTVTKMKYVLLSASELLLVADLVRWSWLESLPLSSSSVGTSAYGVGGSNRMNGKDERTSTVVPIESINKYPLVSSGNARSDRVEKKKALRPKPERGNAVAVPRCFGQLTPATRHQRV